MVTSVSETFGRQYTDNATGLKTAVKVFCVVADTNYTQLSDLVRDAVTAGLPALGDAYGADSGETSLIAVSHTPVEIQMELAYYNIEVRYETSQTIFSAPADRPWTITFSALYEEYVPEQTLFNTGTVLPSGQIKAVGINQPILNAAGLPFDPPVTDTKTKLRISLSKNFLDVDEIGTITTIDGLMTRVNTVNDDTLTIAGITGDYFQFYMEGIDLTNVDQDGQQYYQVTFNIIYDNEYHFQKVLNAGWVDANGKEILGDNGGPINNPWVLDANGAPIRGGAAARQAGAIYYGFGVKRLTTFGDLSLPTAYGQSSDLPVT